MSKIKMSAGLAFALMASTSVFAAGPADERMKQIEAEINKLKSEKAALAKNPSAYVAPKAAAQAPVAPKQFSWTGFYGGLHAVVARDHETKTTGQASQSVNNAGVSYSDGSGTTGTVDYEGISTGSVSGSNFSTVRPAGGAEIGFNYQINQFVAGAAIDYTWLGIKQASGGGLGLGAIDCLNGPVGYCDTEGATYNLKSSYSLTTRMNGLATARGKLGVAIDNVLIFGSAGLAMGDVRHSLNASGDASVTAITPTISQTKSGQKFGWVAGGGVEYAITEKVSLKSEYYYYDLGTTKLGGTVTDGANETFTTNFKVRDTGQLGRIGLNVRY